MTIAIISASIRIGRKSHRLALYFQNYITENNLASVELLDLNIYQFPLFGGRLSDVQDPSLSVLEFEEKIKNADGILIVTPEYNGGYPASLKNVLDLFLIEWKRKPVALATASNGVFGGAQVTTSLIFTLWKIGVCLVPAMFPVPKVQDAYSDTGVPVEKEITDKRANTFIGELLWLMNCVRESTP